MKVDFQVKRFKDPQAYENIYALMRQFTLNRQADTQDELWLLEHQPVFTQGQAGKAEHLLNPGVIPVIQSDRGGQVTYHGPGQLMIYALFDLKRLQLGIKDFVQKLEQSVITLLKSYGIEAHTQCKAPGVYVDNAKICSLGLRIRHYRAYHGMSLNVKMDLSPFSRINPCGFKQLTMTQISEHVPDISVEKVAKDYPSILMQQFSEEVIPCLFGESHDR
ncbi:MAG: lipoyl(octanoyl) transferase LipB [Proteobacteria bacterium]|nr:lipoyl(octanoyl) transferase LipB [Pseudomonadota bacterium]